MTHPALELRSALRMAASASGLAYAHDAGRAAATEKQIDLIVALARGSNNYNVQPGARLTSRDASRIIEAMQDRGAVADYNKSDEELDAEDERAAEIAATAAAKKAAKQSKKANKAVADARFAEQVEAMRKSGGRRVRHTKFGEGIVIREDAHAITILFDSQPKPLRVLPSFVTAI